MSVSMNCGERAVLGRDRPISAADRSSDFGVPRGRGAVSGLGVALARAGHQVTVAAPAASRGTHSAGGGPPPNPAWLPDFGAAGLRDR